MDGLMEFSPRTCSRRKPFLALWLALSAVCTCAPSAAAFGARSCERETFAAQSGAPVLRSEVNLRAVDVQVKNRQGNDVLGLTANDFTVREDGKPQKIAFFDAGNGPVTVAVLVDSSSSMVINGDLGSAEAVATRFMRLARPADDVWAMDFTEWTGPFEHMTGNQLSNPKSVAITEAGGSGSAVYDAIASAICHLRSSQNPRQAIIVITDGVDEHSRISLDRLIQLIRAQRAQLFLIGLPSRPEFRLQKRGELKVRLVSGHDIDNPIVVFSRLAKEASAETFIPKSEQGLHDALKAVSNLLESEYTLAYYPPRTRRELRKIEVKVDRRGVRVLGSPFLVSSQTTNDEIVRYVKGTCAVSPKFHPYPYEGHVTQGPEGAVYRDDFSDQRSGWPEHPDSHYVSGGYELSTVVHETTEAMPSMTADVSTSMVQRSRSKIYHDNVVAAYGPSWGDFRMSADMRAILTKPVSTDVQVGFSHPVHPAAGLVFRMNWKGYYALLVSPSPGDRKKLSFELVARTFQGDSFAETVIVPWTILDRKWSPEVRLSVKAVGDRFIMFVDRQQLATARDDTFSDGYAGFVVSASGRATFSNLLVEAK